VQRVMEITGAPHPARTLLPLRFARRAHHRAHESAWSAHPGAERCMVGYGKPISIAHTPAGGAPGPPLLPSRSPRLLAATAADLNHTRQDAASNRADLPGLAHRRARSLVRGQPRGRPGVQAHQPMCARSRACMHRSGRPCAARAGRLWLCWRVNCQIRVQSWAHIVLGRCGGLPCSAAAARLSPQSMPRGAVTNCVQRSRVKPCHASTCQTAAPA